MPKFATIIAGGLEIAGGVALGVVTHGAAAQLSALLISAGVGTVIGGLGTLLSKGPVSRGTQAMRNPLAPREVVYGETKVGGIPVYVHQWPAPGNGAGGNYQMVDMVFAIATHPCDSIVALFFDNQRIQIDTTAKPTQGQLGGGPLASGPYPGAGTSFTPVQQKVNITTIARNNGVVTVTLPANIPYLIEGDLVQIVDFQNSSVLAGQGLTGTVQVQQILSQVAGSPGSIVFTYLSGGTNDSVSGNGQVVTLWADYGRTVYFEALLGGQVQGQTFAGMTFGTPLDGDMGDFIAPTHTGGITGADQPNPWTTSCSGINMTAVMVRIHLTTQYYTGGLPQISFQVKGKNNIIDPRNSPATPGYTNNWALCVADFLATAREWGGFGLSYGTNIPLDYLIAAANTCDEAVPLASLNSPPPTEPAYTLDGRFTLATHRGEVLQNMLTAAAGRLTTYQGQHILWPAAWTGISFAIGSNPGGSIIPLGNFENIAAGPVKWRAIGKRDLFNGVKGTYVSQAAKWEATDFPPYAQDTLHGYSGPSSFDGDANLAADGGDRLWFDTQLPFTTDYARAQRIAKIELLRKRQFWNGTLTLNMAGYQITPLDIIQITGIPGQPWTTSSVGPALAEVTRVQLKIGDEGREDNSERGPQLVVEIDIQEVDPDIYDWNTEEELSPEGYHQPQVAGGFNFFATETIPGFNVPFPWSPGYEGPLVGDSLFPGPVEGSPAVNEARATFGLQGQYGTDGSGNPIINMLIRGSQPPNALSTIAPPQITVVPGSMAGSLPAGTYVVAASAYDTNSPSRMSQLGVGQKITIPPTSPPGGDVGSIAVAINWPPDSNGGELFLAYQAEPGTTAQVTRNGYYLQAQLTSADASYLINWFDQSQTGAPDSTYDHVAVAWKSVEHGGIWATQIAQVTANTITLGGVEGINADDYAGRTLTLLGKADSTKELIVLNMPIESNTAAVGGAGGVQATVFGVMFAVPNDGDTVIAGGKTYTFQITLTNVDGNVQIGPDALTSLANLASAIGLDPLFVGTAFAAATTANLYVEVQSILQEQITLAAVQFGTPGNALTVTGTAPFGWTNGGNFTGGALPGQFTVTIGMNSAGDQLPDLTTLLEPFDLVVCRFNATFGPASFSDSMIANPFYPQGATGVEPGHVALMMTGANAGDAQVISAVNTDGSGNYTEFILANPWMIQPADGDIVIVVEAAWGPEFHAPSDIGSTAATVPGVVAAPEVTNLAGQTWLIIARAQTADDINGPDQYSPVREMFLFAAQGTRSISTSQTLLTTDYLVFIDASGSSPTNPLVITIPPFDQIPNQKMLLMKVDSSQNPVYWQTSGSPQQDTIQGETNGILTSQWQELNFWVGAE